MFKFFPDYETILEIRLGSVYLSVRWYAFLILVGALIAYYVAKKDKDEAKYISDDFFDSIFIYLLWGGIIGARLWYCIFHNFSFYFSNPINIIRIWDGGLAIQGGIVAGAIIALLYSKKNNISFLKILDIILPNVLIGQAVGRWGNFVNKECHGGEVLESYFDGILAFLKEGMYINGHYYEPLFFYESLGCIIGWFLIHQILKKYQNKRGDLAYGYLMWYGTIRFFIEGRRTDSLYLGNLKMAQITSIAFVLIGVIGYFGLFDKIIKKKKPTILFDLDGTLIDTRGSIYAGFEACFKEFSDISKFDDEVKDAVIGPSLKEMFPLYFPDTPYEEVYKLYSAKQKEAAPKLNKLTNGTYEALKELKDEGYHLGIVSSRMHDSVKDLLIQNGIDEFFEDIVGVDNVENPKPNKECIELIINRNSWNKDVLMVGDSKADMDCALNYGAYRVAFISKEDRYEALVDNSNICINDMKELSNILKKNISFTYNEK